MQQKIKPLLLVSDAVSGSSGLARITRDLATRIHANLSDVYRVATAGYAGTGSSRFPFMQYSIEGIRDWVLPTLPDIWQDHARGEVGAILFIWDTSRTTWFAQPQMFPELLESFPHLPKWLAKPSFEKWLYTPIDATGPNDRHTFPIMQTLFGFDRILAYGKWAAGTVERTLGRQESDKRHLDFLPHGIDSETFTPMPRAACRRLFLKRTGALPPTPSEPQPIQEDEILIGIVATNNPRKDWALGIETAALLAKNHKVRLWIHTNALESHWSIAALVIDFGLVHNTVISLGQISDERMAEAYSACDLTLGIGAGEGFGYPIFESIFCGTPCIHGDYGGAPEWMNPGLLVTPVAYRYETLYSCKRPVFTAWSWADKAEQWIGKRVSPNTEIDWENLWPRWEAYLRNAAK